MFRKAILTTVSAVAMISAPALADDLNFAGVLSGNYVHTGSDLPDANGWGINGAAAIDLSDTGFAAELDAGHNHLSISSADANDWNVGGSLFWKCPEGRFGANVNYTEVNLSVLSVSPDFRPAYDPLLAMASALSRSNISDARALLTELTRLQPARSEARAALARLDARP